MYNGCASFDELPDAHGFPRQLALLLAAACAWLEQWKDAAADTHSREPLGSKCSQWNTSSRTPHQRCPRERREPCQKREGMQ